MRLTLPNDAAVGGRSGSGRRASRSHSVALPAGPVARRSAGIAAARAAPDAKAGWHARSVARRGLWPRANPVGRHDRWGIAATSTAGRAGSWPRSRAACQPAGSWLRIAPGASLASSIAHGPAVSYLFTGPVAPTSHAAHQRYQRHQRHQRNQRRKSAGAVNATSYALRRDCGTAIGMIPARRRQALQQVTQLHDPGPCTP
jgi:hypothetical protein